MIIDKFVVGGSQVFLIAEIGNNHNGNFDLAIELIDAAISVGANCAKFQMRNLDSVYRKRSLLGGGEDLSTEYTIDLLKKFELSVDQHQKLFHYCNSKGMTYLCTPWDESSIVELEKIGVMAYKVSSADLTNMPLLERLSNTGKPLILSTGMSLESEILVTVNYLNKRSVEFALLHCNSTYPAPIDDINLRWIKSLEKIHSLVGYSGHERGINISMAAVALGAKIIERHLTLDRLMEGPDHAASLHPAEFKLLANGIREIEKALGDGLSRKMSQGEMINRENLGKSLVAATDLKKGIIISHDHISIKSPGQGISPQRYDELIGKILNRDMKCEDFFFQSDLETSKVTPKEYHFSRPWGLPVRYHDFREFSRLVKPDIWEFHLSYSDLDLDPQKYLNIVEDVGFVVHAPELFSESHLLDLASSDRYYRAKSIENLQRVIDITNSLKEFFPREKVPLIVVNVGGFSMDEKIPKENLKQYYERFTESMNLLSLSSVEIIPQTMAPFPWHFGGQRFQNMFVEQDEIIYWCKKLGMRMCLDVSHSYLASNHLGFDFYNFCREVSPYVAHYHIGDAIGTNGEGLQIGAGEIDFQRLSAIIKETAPNASFIPEIWQGHKNGGEGFWLSLDRLNKLL